MKQYFLGYIACLKNILLELEGEKGYYCHAFAVQMYGEKDEDFLMEEAERLKSEVNDLLMERVINKYGKG